MTATVEEKKAGATEGAGGRIKADWRPDGERGACFRIALPAARRVAPT